jgi:SAM-dependent methyltransferase
MICPEPTSHTKGLCELAGETSCWDTVADVGRLPSPRHPGVAENARYQIELMRRFVPIGPETHLLEIACGWGCFTYHFNRVCDVYGIDASPRMLEANPVKKTSVMDAANLEFDDDSFDVVFCRNMLHHADDIDRVIGEMRRVTRKHVVMVEPNKSNPLNFLIALAVKDERQILEFSLANFSSRAARNGLRVLSALAYGVLIPAVTPAFLVPLKRLTDFRQPLGLEAMVIAEKAD